MELKLVPAIPQAVTKYDIQIGGKHIGYVEQREDRTDGYRAALQIEITTYQKAYVYGLGDTPESAITNAINTGRKEVETQIAELEKLSLITCKAWGE